MSSIIQSYLPNQTAKIARKKSPKTWAANSSMLIIAALAFSATACSTTQEFKPTASVLVGAQKSI